MNASDLSEGLGICVLRNNEPQWTEGHGIYKDGKMITESFEMME